MIRTAEQILADIQASGGEVDEPETVVMPEVAKARRGSSRGVVDTEPKHLKGCQALRCPNPSPERKYCSTHRTRLRKYGSLLEHVPIRPYVPAQAWELACGCCICPGRMTRREKPKVEKVGDVWLAVLV